MSITSNEKKILKCFLALDEPVFVGKLGLQYETDYYYGNISRILKGVDASCIKLEDNSYDTKRKILAYLDSYGNYDDLVYYHFLEIVYNIFCKYCS